MSKELQLLMLHATDTPAGRKVTAADIRAWHTLPKPKGNGWRQVGYSDMVHLDGTVENLVPYNQDNIVDPWEITNGAAGYNAVARHIVYVGGKGGDTRTEAQKEALKRYVLAFIKQHPQVKVCGHYQFNKGKTCPSFDVVEWCREIGVPGTNIYTP